MGSAKKIRLRRIGPCVRACLDASVRIRKKTPSISPAPKGSFGRFSRSVIVKTPPHAPAAASLSYHPRRKKSSKTPVGPSIWRSTRQTSNILSRRPSEIPFVSVLSPFPRPPPAFVSALPPSSLSRSHILSSRNPTDASAIPRLSEPTEGKETGMGILSPHVVVAHDGQLDTPFLQSAQRFAGEQVAEAKHAVKFDARIEKFFPAFLRRSPPKNRHSSSSYNLRARSSAR